MYATIDDLQNLGIPDRALQSTSVEEREAALLAASRFADGYLTAQFKLPLISWAEDLTDAVVSIAIYRLMARRGYNPEAGGNSEIRQRYDDAVLWLEGISDGKIHPQIVDSTPNTDEGGLFVFTSSRRGW